MKQSKESNLATFSSAAVIINIFNLIKLKGKNLMPKNSKESDRKNINEEIAWIQQKTNYQKISNQELQDENKRIIHALKMMEAKLDRELEQQQKIINLQQTQQSNTNHEKVMTEQMKTNDTVIKTLEKQVKKLKERREGLKNGQESKLNAKKYELQKKSNDLKSELKKMKLEQKELNKKLEKHQNANQPESLSDNIKLEEELRVYSIKYMKMLEKYNKVTEQLAIASNTSEPELHIPEEFYNQQLEERQEAQYKEYQGIVKLCTILSKRNDSENNKFNRIYTEKLKELEKTIINLGQVDRMIALREGEIIQGKKNIELVKFKISNNQKVQDHFLSLSQSSLRRKSHSLTRLSHLNKQRDLNNVIDRKLSKR